MEFEIEVVPGNPSLKRKREIEEISSSSEEIPQRVKKQRIRRETAESARIQRRSYIADSDDSSPGSEGPPSDDEEEDLGPQPWRVTLEQFLSVQPSDQLKDPRYILSGINDKAERLSITLQPYLRPLQHPRITSDIDSVHLISRYIPTTTDFTWTVHSVTEINIADNIHLTANLGGEQWSIHKIPNMYIGRFLQNNIFTVHIAFPGLRRQENGKWTSYLKVEDRRDFYDKVFYPALRQVMPKSEWGHVPFFDYEAERRRKTDFQGHMRQAQLLIANRWLRDIVIIMRGLSQTLGDDKRFSNMLFSINAKNSKLLTRSTAVNTRAALKNQLAGLDMRRIDLDTLFVDIGFEILPDIEQEPEDYTLVWKKSKLKVK